MTLLTAEPLDLNRVIAQVASPARGGLVTFTGIVRDATKGRAVLRLEYEAYGSMAERELARVISRVEARWPDVRVALMHRVGTLVPGEAAVVIAAAAPHRADAFAACQATIDDLKQSVPIWKKEHFADGAVWVGLGP